MIQAGLRLSIRNSVLQDVSLRRAGFFEAKLDKEGLVHLNCKLNAMFGYFF